MSNQSEKNLEQFVHILKTNLNDVDSFTKPEITAYFLTLRKFFKNYVKDNNKIYSHDSPLYIGSRELDSLERFMNNMIFIFDQSQTAEHIGDMRVIDKFKLLDLQNQLNNLLATTHEMENLVLKTQSHGRKLKDDLGDI